MSENSLGAIIDDFKAFRTKYDKFDTKVEYSPEVHEAQLCEKLMNLLGRVDQICTELGSQRSFDIGLPPEAHEALTKHLRGHQLVGQHGAIRVTKTRLKQPKLEDPEAYNFGTLLEDL